MDIHEIDAQGPPWHPKHEGVPLSWKHMGDGGNAHVWRDGDNAIKRLRPNASKEPVARFAREAQLLNTLSGETGLSIVPVVDVRKRWGEVEVVMEALDGNLAAVIDEFQGQPEKAAIALLPIIQTLARLSERQHPIHHRDIKPENLLYRRVNGKIDLFLGDFGCAYLAEDERLTPTHRAIGAWAYRPPEYCIGRVVAVDEKGDVFSLGKVFWAMVNGERHVVFPGPIWFQEEFSLALKFPETSKIHHTMVLIAQACDIRPEKRPTLTQFGESLRNLIEQDVGEKPLQDDELNAAMLRKEAQREVEYQQRRAYATEFVCAVHEDFIGALARLHRELPQSKLFSEWVAETNRRGQSQEALIFQVAERESDAHITNVFYQQSILITRFFPATAVGPIRFDIRIEDRSNQIGPSIFSILGNFGDLQSETTNPAGDRSRQKYQNGQIAEFLKEAVRQLP